MLVASTALDRHWRTVRLRTGQGPRGRHAASSAVERKDPRGPFRLFRLRLPGCVCSGPRHTNATAPPSVTALRSSREPAHTDSHPSTVVRSLPAMHTGRQSRHDRSRANHSSDVSGVTAPRGQREGRGGHREHGCRARANRTVSQIRQKQREVHRGSARGDWTRRQSAWLVGLAGLAAKFNWRDGDEGAGRCTQQSRGHVSRRQLSVFASSCSNAVCTTFAQGGADDAANGDGVPLLQGDAAPSIAQGKVNQRRLRSLSRDAAFLTLSDNGP